MLLRAQEDVQVSCFVQNPKDSEFPVDGEEIKPENIHITEAEITEVLVLFPL